MKHRDTTITRGNYRGIVFEINHPDENYKFTYYISLDLERFQDKEFADSLWLTATETGIGKQKRYKYSDIDFFNEIHFHGGITWYSKLFSLNDDRIIKIGCDYNHSFDQWNFYDLDDVLNDVRKTIDDIHENSTYLLFCHGDGSLVQENKGLYSKHGDFWSRAYIEKREMNLNDFVLPKAIESTESPQAVKEDLHG
jgi:hypothetical protein